MGAPDSTIGLIVHLRSMSSRLMLLSTVWIVVFCLFCLSFDPATGIPGEQLPGKTDSVVAMLQQNANMQENTHAPGKTVENTDVQTNSKSKQDEEAEWF